MSLWRRGSIYFCFFCCHHYWGQASYYSLLVWYYMEFTVWNTHLTLSIVSSVRKTSLNFSQPNFFKALSELARWRNGCWCIDSERSVFHTAVATTDDVWTTSGVFLRPPHINAITSDVYRRVRDVRTWMFSRRGRRSQWYRRLTLPPQFWWC